MRVDTAKRSSGRRQYRKRNNLPNGAGVRRLARGRMQDIRPAARMTHPACRLAETSTPFEAGILRWRTRPRTQLFLQRPYRICSLPLPKRPWREPCSTCFTPASHARRPAFDPQGALVRQPSHTSLAGCRRTGDGARALPPAPRTGSGPSAAQRERYAKGIRMVKLICVRTGRIDGRRATRPAPA